MYSVNSSQTKGNNLENMSETDTIVNKEFPEQLVFKKIGTDETLEIFIFDHTSIKSLMRTIKSCYNIQRAGSYFNFEPEGYQISFNGKRYGHEITLGEIHAELNLNSLGTLRFEKTNLLIAKEKLEAQTKLEWKMFSCGTLRFESTEIKKNEIEKFKADLFLRAPHLKGLLKIKFGENLGYNSGGSYKYFGITISIANPKNIRKIAELQLDTLEIKKAAPIIAQATTPSNSHNPLGNLPIDVLATIGEFLAPKSPDARQKIVEEIEKAKQNHSISIENYIKNSKFKKIKPIEISNAVRQSIGASVCLIVRNGMINQEQAKNRQNIASIDFSQQGMVFKFPDELYGKQFFHALQNADYKSISQQPFNEKNQYGTYIYSVTMSDLNEVKKFIENTCGYSDTYTRDLFKVEKIKLSSNFFINELTAIGKPNDSLSNKKEKAKNFIATFLPFLNVSEAESLKLQIQTNAATSYDKDKPNALQYLREKRGIVSIFSSEDYADTDTYVSILKDIDLVTPPEKEETLTVAKSNS